MIQEAEELKSVPAPVLHSNEEVELTTSLICRSEVGALRVLVAEDCHLAITKWTRRQRKQSRYVLSPWITGSLGSPRTNRTIHSQFSPCGIARVKASGVTQCRRRLWYARTLQGLRWLIWTLWCTNEISSSPIRSPAVSPSVTVKNGWHGEIVPEASPMGESKSNGEVDRAVQSVYGLARTLKEFLEQKSGIALESRSPLLAWLVEHCSNLLQLFRKGEPHDVHTAYMRLKLEN